MGTYMIDILSYKLLLTMGSCQVNFSKNWLTLTFIINIFVYFLGFAHRSCD